MTIGEFKSFACKQLSSSPSALLDVNVFLEHFLHLSKTQILLNHKMQLSDGEFSVLCDAVEKRKAGLPVAYITGVKEFFGFNFFVTPDVLIPKPDTEILVQRGIEIILEKMDAFSVGHFDNQKKTFSKILTVCDMCTGSGCIALSVAKTLLCKYNVSPSDLPNFTLVDISSAALQIARKNAELLNIPQDKIRFVQSNLFEQFTYDGGWSYDVILTNPPYIPHKLVDELLKDGRSEPRLALDGDVCTQKKGSFMPGDFSGTDDGLEIIRSLFPQAQAHLSPGGFILMETGEYNAEDSQKIALSLGFKTTIHKDFEGQLRVLECK